MSLMLQSRKAGGWRSRQQENDPMLILRIVNW